MNSYPVIAIDGYASTGKSTLSKMLSSHFQIPFIDSGAFYRGITFFALKKGFINNDKLDQSLLSDSLDTLNLSYDTESGNLYLNGKNGILDILRIISQIEREILRVFKWIKNLYLV